MNPIVAAVRSVVQAIIALAVVAVANFVLTNLGVVIDEVAITEALSVFAFGLLVWLFNWIGTTFPIVNTVLSLGLSTGGASYEA
ncbi:hypothetical protein LCGC14_1404830 [marine sediment metagenome]|uniref:Uncharacterized protein n=1 Tax=marine sediment metagenome TaxID=412755 RepID=A0A0F9JVZ6_9ZZZZ